MRPYVHCSTRNYDTPRSSSSLLSSKLLQLMLSHFQKRSVKPKPVTSLAPTRTSWTASVKQILVSACNEYVGVLQIYQAKLNFIMVSVVKMKFRRVKKRTLVGNKVNTVFKTWRGTPSELRKLRKPKYVPLYAINEPLSEM